MSHRDRKVSVSYKSTSHLPKEPELKELKIYVGKELSVYLFHFTYPLQYQISILYMTDMYGTTSEDKTENLSIQKVIVNLAQYSTQTISWLMWCGMFPQTRSMRP